jgi:hypothetical protein
MCMQVKMLSTASYNSCTEQRLELTFVLTILGKTLTTMSHMFVYESKNMGGG